MAYFYDPVMEGSISQQMEILTKMRASDVKANYKTAKKLHADGNTKDAVKLINDNIKYYESLKVEAKKMDDDQLVSLRTLIILFVPIWLLVGLWIGQDIKARENNLKLKISNYTKTETINAIMDQIKRDKKLISKWQQEERER